MGMRMGMRMGMGMGRLVVQLGSLRAADPRPHRGSTELRGAPGLAAEKIVRRTDAAPSPAAPR